MFERMRLRHRSMSKSRILLLTLLNAAVVACIGAIPFAVHHVAEMRRLEEERQAVVAELRAMAAESPRLAPCREHGLDRPALRAALKIDPAKVRFAAIVAPAFEAEYAIAVDKDGPDDAIRIERFNRSHWYAVESPGLTGDPAATSEPLETTTTLRRLDRAVLDRLAQEWTASVASATAAPRLGRDGASYVFLTPAGCGSVWLPEADTRPGQLADLVESLVRGEQDDVIARKLDELTPLLPEPGQDVDPSQSGR